MFLYIVMAFWAAVGLAFNTRLSSMMATAIAPSGALMTFLALWTGALWGRPTWGAYWVWDARLTSELILLFLYLGFIALQAAIDDRRRADKAGAVLAIIGVINVPIIYFSVKWWNTLHQGASVSVKGSSMATVMLWGMLVMALAFWMYAIAAVLHRVRTIILEREKRSRLGPGTCSAGEAQVNWGSWDAFWSMGGYGLYVWGSYAMTVIVLGLEIWKLKSRRRAAVLEAERERTRARSTS